MTLLGKIQSDYARGSVLHVDGRADSTGGRVLRNSGEMRYTVSPNIFGD